MKELQNYIYRHMDALKHHKRYLAMLTALSMLVTFIVPLILIEPADSMSGILICGKEVHTHNADCYIDDVLVCDMEEHIHTGQCYKRISTTALKGEGATQAVEPHNDNIPLYNAGGGYDEETGKYNSVSGNTVGEVTYSPAEVPLYTLLFGEGNGHWVDPTKSLDENLQIVNQEYFLGFANDFCAFIESDFTATEADAEGRMFVGGDLSFKKNWNYQIGSGDYGSFTPLGDTVEYLGISGFASAIVGGKLYRVNTLSTGHSDNASKNNAVVGHKNGQTVFYKPENGLYKNFIVGNINESLHYIDSAGTDKPYTNNFGGCNHNDYPGNCTICASGTDHDYIGQTNELSQLYQYSDVGELLEKTFDTIKSRSLSLASIQATEVTIPDNHVLTLDATNVGDAKTAYFRLDSWGDISEIVIKVPEDRVKYGDSKYTQNNRTIIELDLNIIITCDDETININCPDGGRGMRTVIQVGNDPFQISKIGDDNSTNNHPISSNILYNFPNAKLVEFKDTMGTGGANFNGTIMAPYAHVKSADDPSPGHLSGALIAKSFYGGLEFGYRPYRGGVDIFGMTSGYAIPVNKVDENNKALPGALFAVKEDGKFVSLFESGNGTNFAALPSRVDFTGNTAYKPEHIEQTTDERPYVGTEIQGEKLTAPVDFTLHTDSNCSNGIVENSNILPKFYLDANQALNIDANENFKCVEVDSNNHIYEIQLIKPVTSLTITARNQGNSAAMKEATINFIPMTLTVQAKDNSSDFTVGDSVQLNVENLPIAGEEITYKYFLNGSQIEYNDSYQLNTAGGATFSVGAYVTIDGQEYEIANNANKITVVPQDVSNLSISVPNSVTYGNTFTIEVNNLPTGATATYYFNDNILSKDSTSASYSVTSEQNCIIGVNRPVKVVVTTVDKKDYTFEDAITVNFGTDIKFNDYNTTYDVNPYSNLGFKLENIEKYLNQLPDDKKTITFYFKDEPIQSENFNYAKIDQKLVGENMTVYAVITANGLEHTVYGKSVTGKYNDNLSLYVESGAFIVGNNIHMNVSNAPVEAEVIFEAVDSKGVTQWTDTQTAYNGTCSAVFQTEVAGDYTIKASIKYENNTPKVLVHPNTITVSPKPISGELSINPSEVNAGNAVELKISGAPAEADVIFTISGPNTNSNPTGKTDQNGELQTSFTPNLAGEYTIKAIISKDGASKPVEKKLTVNENTSTLDGNLSIKVGDKDNPETVDSGSTVIVNVTNATNGAVLKLTITGPDGAVIKEETKSISDNTFSCDFNVNSVGAYTVTGTLTSGSQNRPLGERKVIVMGEIEIVAKKGEDVVGEFVKGEPVTLSLKEKPDVTARVEYYLDSLDSSNPMHTKDEFKNVSGFNYDNESITFTPGQTGIHKYRANAIDANGNVIATVTKEFQTVDPTYDVTIKFYNSDDSENTEKVYNAGETVTLRIYGLSKQINNVQGNIPGVAGLSLEKGVETDEYTDYKFVVPNNNCNEKDLVITINLTQGSPIQVKDVITISVPEQNSIPLSIRKYLSILEDENADTSDNKIVIKELDNDTRIENLRIAFPPDVDANNTYFKLEVKGNVGEPIYLTSANVTDSNPDYIDIPSSKFGDSLKKIEIIPIEGSITIDKCYPTYVKNENTLEKTSATGFTLLANEIKEIPVEGWVDALNSITFNFENDTTATLRYALIKTGEENKAPVFSEVKVQNAKSILIPKLNASGIQKIMVYTLDDSLTVKDYIISGFIGDTTYSEEDLENLKNNDLDIINYYTLVEQQAPVGYFKEDTIYTIEVKETIKLDKLVDTRPKVVKTKVTVRDKDGNEKLTYTVEIEDSGDKRTIKIPNDATFEITNSEVKCTEGDVETSTWDTTKPGYYNDKYYFDPNAMMIVPVSDKPIEYTNKMGLLFRKVEKSGAIVKGVEISLVPDESKNGESLWYWDENTSEWLIDYTNLIDEKVYKFTETYGGSKYELADDIYFKKTGDKQITYWIGSDSQPPKKTNENQLTVLNLSESFESRVIRMENIRVVGIKPTLKKTDMDGNIIDGSAKFALYAADGTELLNPIDVVNGKVDFYFDPQKIYDARYVEDGYLKPGSYYLQELNAPDHYEAATRSFGFEIVKNDDDVYSIIPSNPGMGETIGEIAWSTDTKPNYTINELIFYYADGTSKENSKVVEVSNNRYWHKFDYEGAGLDPKNVVGIKLKVGGEDDGDKKFMIRNNKGDELWGQIKDSQYGDYTNVKPRDEYYTFGDVPEDDSQIVVDPKPTIDVGSKNTILISNKPLSNTMNLRVDKKWVGDAGITELRKPVEVQLMQKLGDGEYENYDPPIESAETTDNGTEAVPADSTEETPTSGKVILNAANNWSYVWENLPRYVNGKDDTQGLCYYKINEVTAIDGYTTSIIGTDINNGGTIIIKNTAETMDIPVEKTWTWEAGKYNPTIPRTVKLKLQINVGEESSPNWKDVPGKTLVLTGDVNAGNGGTWQGKFTGLIKGYQYQVVEADVPFGWVPDCGEEVTAPSGNAESFDGKFTVTNNYSIPEGSLAVQKLWDEMGGTLPHSITVDLYRSVIAPSYTETDAPWTDENSEKADADKNDYKTDYARLLQHSLYFYDANMCGTDVAANSALAWRTNCHTEDEVPGGYHDAGDHVMFGLPQGYAASMLGWTYYEFIKGNAKIPSEEANHFKVILERFYDFFANSVRYDENGDISEILVQKGGGNIDHSYWGSPEKQVTREKEMFWSNYGADIASEYAAALALGYLNFKDSDSEKYEKYLKVAKDLFEFAEKNPSAYNEWGVNKDETQKSVKYPGFYDSQTHNDDMALAAGWLHLADPNGGYKDKFDAIGKNDDKWFSWNDVSLAAYAVGAYIGSNSWSTFADKINEKIDEDNPEKYFFQDGWGSARYNAIMQTAALVAAKHDQNKEKYKSWAQGQMNMLLGDNDWNDKINGVCDGGTVSNTNSPICLVTNFVPDGFTTDTPEAPHHRAASGWDSLEEYKVNCGYDDDSYALIGAMVGGPSFGSHDDGKQQQMYDYAHDHPLAEHSYIDCLHDYCCNEVSIDYNAGLVGAAAGLYYFYGSGAFSNKIEGVEYGAYGLDPYVESDIEFNNAQNNPLVDEDINAAVLKSFAMKQTKVRVMTDEPYTLNTTELEAVVSGDGWSFPDSIAGKSISSIEVNLSNYPSGWTPTVSVFLVNPYTFKVVDMSLPQSGYFSIEPNGNGEFVTLQGWDSIQTLKPNEITFLRIVTNQFSVESVTINFAGGGTPTSGITLSDTEVNIGETVDITVTGEKTGDFTQSSTDDGEVEFNEAESQATAKEPGKVTIKATVDGEEKTAELTIKPMNLIAPEGNIVKGNSVKFSVSEPPVGATKVEYKCGDTLIGESNGQPNFEISHTFPDSGDYTITAIAHYGENETTSAECPVNVLAEAPIPIEITNVPNPAELIEGDKHTFTSNKDNAKWRITSNNPPAVIDEDSGELTAKNVGSETQITVRAYTSESDYRDVTIKILPINITYNGQNSLSLKLGDTTEYDLNVDRGTDLIWGSTNTAVVSVVDDKNGKIKVGSTTGTAQIFVSKNGETLATFNVTVNSESSDVEPQQMSFSKTTDVLYTGGSFTFGISSLNGTNRVDWFVENNDKASVTKNNFDGIVTLADGASGSVKIIAKAYDAANNWIGYAETTIYNIQTMGIQSEDTYKIGKDGEISLNNKPNNYSRIEWTLEENNEEASISGNNDKATISGKKEGEVVIVAKVYNNNNDAFAVARKTVEIVKPNITLNDAKNSLKVGEELQLSINADGLDSSKYSVTWSSSKDSVATVDSSNGKVKAVGVGSVTITATVTLNDVEYTFTKNIEVTEYLPDPPGDDYKLITSYAYPEGNNTVQNKPNDLVISLDSILGTHPVDAVIVEFEKGNTNFNGVVYWSDSSLYKADGVDENNNPVQDPKFKYDSCDSFTIKFNEVGYTDGETRPKYFAIRKWWADGSFTVKKVYFYAKTLEPQIINAPSEMAVDDKYTLKAIALSGAASWTSSDPDIATIDPATGEITALKAGNVTFTANNSVSVTIPIKRKLEFIDENGNPVEISKIRNNVTANLSIYGEGVEYEITEGEDIITIDSETGTLTPIEGKTGTVKFKAIYAGENESNTVTLTVVDALKIIGENQQMPVGTKQQLTVENAIGDVEWSIKSGKTDIIEITENGLVIAKAYGQETVVVRDSDGATVEFIIDAIVKPLLPKDTENVKRVEFTAKNAIIKDVVDGKLEPESDFETTNHEDWTVKLENLPLCDEKGNPYYYYIEETMYKKTSSSLDETLDPKNANGYYVLSSDTKYVPIGYNAQGSVPTEENYPTLRVGNMATEKVEGQLPSTGGSGVTTYYYLGGVIMLLSIAGFTGLKRRERKRRKE